MFRISLVVLRVARAIAFLGLLFILAASVFELFGNDNICIDKMRGKLKFSISKTIALTTPTLKLPAMLQIDNSALMNQITETVSKDKLVISSYFKTGIAVINLSTFQFSCILAYTVLIVLVYFFVFHFMIKIMKNVLKNEMLSINNNSYLKSIGLIIIVSPIALYVFELLYIYSYSFTDSSMLNINGFGASIRNEPKFEVFIYSAIGLFIYMLAKVQEYGLKLKQENDLTI